MQQANLHHDRRQPRVGQRGQQVGAVVVELRGRLLQQREVGRGQAQSAQEAECAGAGLGTDRASPVLAEIAGRVGGEQRGAATGRVGGEDPHQTVMGDQVVGADQQRLAGVARATGRGTQALRQVGAALDSVDACRAGLAQGDGQVVSEETRVT